MPIAVAFAEPDTFMMHARGDVTHAECLHAMDTMMAHPAYSRATRILVDANGVTGAPSASEVRLLARDYKPIIDSGLDNMAIVSGQVFVYGVARIFAAFAEIMGLKVRAFRDIAEAEEWLKQQPSSKSATKA